MPKASQRIKIYPNPNGQQVSTVDRRVFTQDGLTFKDIDGSGSLSAVNDWRNAPGSCAGQVLLAKNRFAAELPLVQNAVLVGFALHILVHGSHGTGHGVLCHTPVRNKQLGDFFLDGKLLHIGSGTHGGGIAPVIARRYGGLDE